MFTELHNTEYCWNFFVLGGQTLEFMCYFNKIKKDKDKIARSLFLSHPHICFARCTFTFLSLFTHPCKLSPASVVEVLRAFMLYAPLPLVRDSIPRRSPSILCVPLISLAILSHSPLLSSADCPEVPPC